MKFTVLSFLIFLIMSCQSKQALTLEYKYQRDEFISALSLSENSSDKEIEAGLNGFMNSFGLDLKYDYENGRLLVTGSENELKAFEFISLNLFEFHPRFRLKGNIRSSMTKQSVSFDTPISSYETRRIRFEASDDKEAYLEADVSVSFQRFDSKARVNFSLKEGQGEYGELANSLEYTGIFQNLDKKEAFINIHDSQGQLSGSLVSSLQLEWEIKNSYFFKTVDQTLKRPDGKFFTAVHTYSTLDDLIGNAEAYLNSLGLEIGDEDRLIVSKSQKTLFLCSNKEKSSYLREIFRPLCCFTLYEAELSGEIENKDGIKAEFKIPVTMGSSSSIGIENESSLSLTLDYKMGVEALPLIIGGWYKFSRVKDEDETVYENEPFESFLYLNKSKSLRPCKGHLIKLKCIDFKEDK